MRNILVKVNVCVCLLGLGMEKVWIKLVAVVFYPNFIQGSSYFTILSNRVY